MPIAILKYSTSSTVLPIPSQCIIGREPSLNEALRKGEKKRCATKASRLETSRLFKQQNAMKRKAFLESEQYITPGSIMPTSVGCNICGKRLELENRRDRDGEPRHYYAGNWLKHLNGDRKGTIKGCLEKHGMKVAKITPSEPSKLEMLCLFTNDPEFEAKMAREEAAHALLGLSNMQ